MSRSKRKQAQATQIVMLGTGTPRPDPERSGPATVIIANGTPYLIDFGPGVIRRAAAAFEKGVTALGPGGTNLRTVFLTHMHMDHTAGYPDLILTPWVIGRKTPLDVYGPTGLKAMTKHVLAAWKVDIDNRLNGIDRRSPAGCVVNAREIKPGVVYQDENVRVIAFPVRHGEMEPAFGFRFETPDKIIVLSGDTSPTPALAEHCEDCDVLIHETYSLHTYNKVPRRWQSYRRRHHTSSVQLAALANKVKPGLIILYHRSNAGAPMSLPDPEQPLLAEIRRHYRGKVVAGHDLDVF